MSLREMLYFHGSIRATKRNRPSINPVLDRLNASDGALPEIVEYRVPVVRGPVTEPQRYARIRMCRNFPPQRPRRSVKQPLKYFVEPPQAPEAGCHGNFCHRHVRFLDELLGKEYSSGLCHRQRRGAEMFSK